MSQIQLPESRDEAMALVQAQTHAIHNPHPPAPEERPNT